MLVSHEPAERGSRVQHVAGAGALRTSHRAHDNKRESHHRIPQACLACRQHSKCVVPPQSRVTEIAAKTLATLAASDSNQTAVRLAGGIPPLMRLLTVRPSEQARTRCACRTLNATSRRLIL